MNLQLGDERNMVQKIFRAFGTINTITFFDTDSTAILDEIETRMKEMDTQWSVFRDFGDISSINRSAGKEYVRVHSDTYEILRQAVQYSDITGEIFDITMQPLIDRCIKCQDLMYKKYYIKMYN